MEEAFFDTPLYREFVRLDSFGRLPEGATIIRLRHRLAKHKLADQILATVNELLQQRGLLLKVGTAVDATLIAAPNPNKNKYKAGDLEMHWSQKGNVWHFGTQCRWRGCRFGVDALHARRCGEGGRCHRRRQLAARSGDGRVCLVMPATKALTMP